MPIYGEAKQRNMIRSILPSRHRKGAREDLAFTKRNARRETQQALNAYRGSSASAIEHYEYGDDDLTYYPDERISEVVWERRAADNTAALERWAVKVTRDVRQKDRLSHFRSMLPDNTIGRHAAQHVSNLPEMEDPDDPWAWRWWWRRSTSPWYHWTEVEKEWVRNSIAAEYAERLKLVIESGRLKQFNKSVVAHAAERKVVNIDNWEKDNIYRTYRPRWDRSKGEWFIELFVTRPLRGVHDIDAFIKEFRPYAVDRWMYRPDKWAHLDDVLEDLGVASVDRV